MSRFVTSNVQLKMLDALANINMLIGRSNETLKDYIGRHWETYNLIKECDHNIAATSFKIGLDDSTKIFKELMLRPLNNMSALMFTVNKY